jgi:uncharacterized protein (TIGR03437 family)
MFADLQNAFDRRLCIALPIEAGDDDRHRNVLFPAGIFSCALGDGFARAVVQNPANLLNGPAGSGGVAPAKLGEVQVVWANALGPTDRPVADGSPAPSDTLVHTLRTVEVFVNGVSQTVQFSGLAPGFSGVYQVNFALDPATPVLPEGENYVWLRVNGAESPQLAISIQ